MQINPKFLKKEKSSYFLSTKRSVLNDDNKIREGSGKKNLNGF